MLMHNPSHLVVLVSFMVGWLAWMNSVAGYSVRARFLSWNEWEIMGGWPNRMKRTEQIREEGGLKCI